MNNKLSRLVLFLIIATVLFTGCEAIGGIFKAGVWTGVVVVVFIVLLVIFIVAKLFSKNKQ